MGGKKVLPLLRDTALLNTLFVKRSEQNGCGNRFYYYETIVSFFHYFCKNQSHEHRNQKDKPD